MESLKENLENLRAQRHDFVSHLQTIYGLIQLGRFQEAQDYIASVCREIKQPVLKLALSQPSLAALLQAKADQANSLGIKIQWEIKDSLDDLEIPPAELISIVGNLLDNSIEALADWPGEEKCILFRIFTTKKGYYC